MAEAPSKFPVILVKTEGKKTIKRTAHSPIAFQQLITQGFAEEKGAKRAQAPRKSAESAK